MEGWRRGGGEGWGEEEGGREGGGKEEGGGREGAITQYHDTVTSRRAPPP